MNRIMIQALTAFLALVPTAVLAGADTNGGDSIRVLHSCSPGFAWTRSQQAGIATVGIVRGVGTSEDGSRGMI